MDDTREAVLEVVDGLEARLRRLVALVAAARDMVSVVSSPDKSLEHAQELLAIADELSPVLMMEVDGVVRLLKSPATISTALPPRAA